MYVYTQSRNLRNLEIALRTLRIWKLRANLEIAWAQLTNIMGWECLRVQSSPCWSSLEALSTPQVWGLSVPIPRLKGREFLRIGELSRNPWHRGLSTCLTLMVTMELQELLKYVPYLYTRWKLKWRPGFIQAIHLGLWRLVAKLYLQRFDYNSGNHHQA